MFCTGVVVSSIVTLTTIHDIGFFINAPDGSIVGMDRDRFRAVAWWLLVIAIAGMITQITLLIFRVLFFKWIILSHFVTFGIIVSI